MSQPVHGYLRFCFELSACAHRNVGAGTQLTGKATNQAVGFVIECPHRFCCHLELIRLMNLTKKMNDHPTRSRKRAFSVPRSSVR
jgi:hypothetical protein